MKERPILMNVGMVRAILDGRKTQTRRQVKLTVGNNNRFDVPGKRYVMNIRDPRAVDFCPCGQPGDRLWVRETWAEALGSSFAAPLERYRQGGADGYGIGAIYRATPHPDYRVETWRPSIHMPRWAARIILEITDVRVERVQDISEYDAKAEGVPPAWLDVNGKDVNAHAAPTFRQGFARMWREIYGAAWLGWDANPWVWVIGFKRIGA